MAITTNGYVHIDRVWSDWADAEQTIPRVNIQMSYEVPNGYSVTTRGFYYNRNRSYVEALTGSHNASTPGDDAKQSGTYTLHIRTQSGQFDYYARPYIIYTDGSTESNTDTVPAEDIIFVTWTDPTAEYDRESLLAGVATALAVKGRRALMAQGGSGALSNITVRSQATTFVETPAEGFYGIGSVTVLGDANLVPENIKEGITILGVEGTFAPRNYLSQIKSITVTSNGTTTVRPDSGYDGLASVVVTVDTPTVLNLQSKTVTPGRSSQTITPDSGYNGLSSVTVSGNSNLIAGNIRKGVSIFGVTGTYENTITVEAVMQAKTVLPTGSQQIVTPDEGYNALSQVTVQAAVLQSKAITPGKNTQYISADSSFTGLSRVTVYGDSNLIAANIRQGATIFGVEGSYSTEQNFQEKTIAPGRSTITVSADSGYNALASVTILGDANLVPEHIADGVTIFGVTGTYVSPTKPLVVTPSLDTQYIVPADGFVGFSSVTVESSGVMQEWEGTQAEYDALTSYDSSTVYYIIG